MNKKRQAWLPDFGVRGWGIVLLAAVFYYCGNLLDAALNSVLSVYNAQFGWDNVQMTGVVTVGGWISIFGVILFGILCKKKGAKFTSAIGLFGGAVALVILGSATSFPMFAVGIILFLFCLTGYMMIGVGQFGANWFPRKTGLYMGLATAGLTISAATLNLIILNVTESYGIHIFMYGLAVVMVVVGIIVCVFVHNYPEEVGCYPDNDQSISREQLDAEKAAMEEYKKASPYTLNKVIRMKETWLVAIGWSLPMMAASGLIGQLGFAMVEYGHDFMFGIMLLTYTWPVGLVGSYLLGVLDDKCGTKLASLVIVVIEAIGAAIILLFGASKIMAAAGAGLMLFAMSGVTNITVSMSTTVFGRKDFENFWPTISTIYKFIVAAGAVVVATVAHQMNYHAAFITAILICAVSFVIMLCTTGKCITHDETMERKLF